VGCAKWGEPSRGATAVPRSRSDRHCSERGSGKGMVAIARPSRHALKPSKERLPQKGVEGNSLRFRALVKS
jgi:hypothetical protein